MDIVACIDKGFVMPTGVMMYSVCVNNPDVDIVFHIIADNSVTQRDKRDLEETVTAFQEKQVVFYLVVETMFASFPSLENRSDLSQAAYYRLMMSEILPDSIQKVLYLDGDIIVRDTLLPLWNTDLSNHAVAAIPDSWEGRMEFYDRLKYPPSLGYFNSGVLLINLAYWREHAIASKFNDILRNRAHDIFYHDQDVLNVLFKDCKVNLPIKYNMNSGFLWKTPEYDYWKYEREVLEARRSPVIVHFTGWKPWYVYQRHPHPFNSTWFRYQDQTRWKGVKFDKRPLKLQVINYVADMLRRYGLKSPVSPSYYIDIPPVD